MAPVCFHNQTGSMVLLSNGNRTAQRSHPQQEFNNGLVMSSEPLRDNELFEIRIDKKIQMWSGSVEIGVTTLDPETLSFPSSATNLQEASWIMSGSSVLRDGRSLIDEYGSDLDQLTEGDRLGVMRTSNGDLQFFINGVSQGVAATNIPPRVFAVVDIYGKCAQVSLVDSTESRLLANDISNENLAAAYAHASTSDDRLRFHERHGSLVILSNNNRTAERTRPADEFNNGVVMTHRPIKDNELFEIRIDELVNKWSGSIEMGVTTHNPDTLKFPATMTNLKSGTIMMSGCGILTNGKGSRREYGEFNLDELREGDRIGLMRKSNSNLHYYINGLDQGIAANEVPPVVYGVVDLYGMTVKVTIVDSTPGSIVENGVSRSIKDNLNNVLDTSPPPTDTEKLLFHPRCGSHATVICGGRSSHRPNALDDFNNAVVLTNRPLRPNELFEVVLERLVVKWAGSIEIGVTTHSPHQLSFPSTMTNIRSGTWMMTGNGIMYNGTTIIDEYGQNLDRLKVGDRVGVLRTPTGALHFFVNGIDQGLAATNVPDTVYGVIDLYGQAAQVSIIDHSDTGSLCTSSSSLTLGSDLRLHHLHGRNARILNQGFTAVRPNAQGEFNDAIVMSNRPLRDGELFEVVIEKMVDRWSGSIEAGVTLIPPEELNFPSTMTDIDHDTWMLSGSAIMQDGSTVRNGYKCDLDQLRVGTRIGMMRHADGSLHYYVNGEDQGVASTYIPPNVYAVIDLYGQCAQVSVVHSGHGAPSSAASSPLSPESSQVNMPVMISNEVSHCFSPCCGKNIVLRSNNTAAFRSRSFAFGLLFSGAALEADELFEVQVEQLNYNWSGSLCIGLTNVAVGNTNLPLPGNATDLTGGDTWLMIGCQIRKNGVLLKDNYGSSLDRLSVGDRVGICRCADATMHVYINGEDLGVAACNLSKKLYSVVDLRGCVEAVSICSSSWPQSSLKSAPNSVDLEAEKESCFKEHVNQEFHENHGRNIQLLNGNLTARRIASYNQGLVISSKPLSRNQLFQVQIDHLDSSWTSSLQIGLIAQSPEKLHFPVSALGFRKSSWIICGECVFQNGIKAKCRYGPNLDSLQTRHLVGVLVDMNNQLHLYVNGVDQGVAAKDIPVCCYAVVDLYGQCDQVTVIESEECQGRNTEPDYREKADIDNGMKEKSCKAQSSDQPGIKNCEYQSACTRFKNLLGLPEGHFVDSNTCYCDNCHKIRGDEPYYRKGDPPRDYAVPFGWCRFRLRLPPKMENTGLQEKWHVAFHGTRVGAIRKILDSGELIPPAEMGLGPFAKEMSSRKKKQQEDFEVSQIFFSPTLRYTGSSAFAPRNEFQDPKTHQVLQARVAFQVYVRPGSYTTGPQRLGAREPIDVHFSNNDLEWHTKERGATALHSLLIRIEGL